MRKIFLVCTFLAPTLFAQSRSFSVGVKAGVPLRDVFPDRMSGEQRLDTLTNRYTIGPMFEWRLPANLSVEFNALYRNTNVNLTAPGLFVRDKVSAWEFPVQLKYAIPWKAIRPYGAVGINSRRLGTIDAAGIPQGTGEYTRRGNVGPTAGLGLTFKVMAFQVSPEVRYTRWGLVNSLQTFPGVTRLDKNQVDLLVGFHF